MRTANACCDWISNQAWKTKVFGQFALQKICYATAKKKYKLSAQVVIRCISKVCDAYKLDKNTRRKFWELGAIAYDDRILSWDVSGMTVSIWATSGRLRISFRAGARQLALLKHRQGETDLILHGGQFYLAAICNVESPDPVDVESFLGVDLGITKIAATSDGILYSGSAVKAIRYRHQNLRTKLQKKQTRGAKRKLKKLAGRESRFATHQNHCISKDVVQAAKRTGRGIAIEDLKGIRTRIRAGRNQRAALHSWAFAQLGAFMTYKAALNGVLLVKVDPRNSSRQCSRCSHVDKLNRTSQSKFLCRSCGYAANADLNAASVIAGRGTSKLPKRAA
jgi:putative transposase